MQGRKAYTTKSKRTNSLAFARVDCHTCALKAEPCDRQRPKCSTCLLKSRKCDGFAMPLSWDSKRMLSFHPSESNVQTTSSNEDDALESSSKITPAVLPSKGGPSIGFRFVDNSKRSRKRRKPCISLPQNAPPSGPSVAGFVPDTGRLSPSLESENDESVANNGVTHGLDDLDLEPDDETVVSDLDFCALETQSTFEFPSWLDFGIPEELFSEPSSFFRTSSSSEYTLEKMNRPPLEEEVVPDLSIQDFDSISPTDLQLHSGVSPSGASTNLLTRTLTLQHPSKDYDWLFDLYDSKFCVLPLTSDLSINPFRCKMQTWQGSQVLFHAILALCYRHLNVMTSKWSDEVNEHRDRAVQILATELGDIQPQDCLNLLEPILILFTLDCTLSATGHWIGHLERAQLILQISGGPGSLISPRHRSQVGMLLWWDAAIALVSRRSPIIDRTYLEYLVAWETRDNWSFFDLTGCPRDLFVFLYDLTELAKQYEIASSMTWLSFNLNPVMEMEFELINWKNELDPSLETEESCPGHCTEKEIYERYDRFHCAEAWRCALLIYIECVFKRDPKSRSPALLKLVRRTLDHIRCCRRSSQTQKQLLLPIFLAGSETSDEGMRAFVKEYCAYWTEKSRYSMFNSVPALLEDIWSTGEWWGKIINTKATGPVLREGVKINTQLLLG